MLALKKGWISHFYLFCYSNLDQISLFTFKFYFDIQDSAKYRSFAFFDNQIGTKYRFYI